MTYVRIANTRLYHIATDHQSRLRGTIHVRCKEHEITADDVVYRKPPDDKLCAQCWRKEGDEQNQVSHSSVRRS